MSDSTTINPALQEQAVGFDFSNYIRNQNLLQTNGTAQKIKTKKTGTTIVGTVYAGGVVLGADTRATNDTEVAERNCEKIHYIAPNIYCCGAGTAADTENTTALISRQLEMLRMDTSRQSRLVTAVTMLKRMLFRYQGHVSAALVLGGCDLQGPHIYQIYPHGSTAKLPYTSMGSGSLAAMAVLESSWQENMSEEVAVQLVQRAIGAGIFNDLGSGSNCDICIIKTDGSVDYRRNAVKPNELAPLRAQVQRSGRLNMRPGLTPIIKSEFKPHPTAAAGGETAMEVE